MVAIVLALIAACLFGVSTVIAKRGLAHVDAQVGSLITIGTGALIYLVLGPFWMRAGDWFTFGFWIFVLNGFIHPMLSMYLSLEATARIGPTVSATFASTAPLFAAIAAVAFLGESISVAIAIGTLGTVAGIMTLSWAPADRARLIQTALLFATGAAVIRGINQTVAKWALDILPSVLMASFVSFMVSFFGSLVIYLLRYRALPRHIPRAGLRYFGLAGTLVSGAVLCMYGALALGTVVTVSPIIAAYPLFTLATAFLLGQENLNGKMMSGVLLVVSGVALITIGSI